MTWTAPAIERTNAPHTAGERAMLDAWLEFHRATLLGKCAGLTGAQLVVRAVEPSTLNLLGLVRHLADVERWWFRVNFAGQDLPMRYSSDDDPEADFEGGTAEGAEADFAAYAEECALARAAAAGHDLDETFSNRRRGTLSLRWVYLHMIEEYARHNGHADLLRERLDGATGD
jgi:hypothetical protein